MPIAPPASQERNALIAAKQARSRALVARFKAGGIARVELTRACRSESRSIHSTAHLLLLMWHFRVLTWARGGSEGEQPLPGECGEGLPRTCLSVCVCVCHKVRNSYCRLGLGRRWRLAAQAGKDKEAKESKETARCNCRLHRPHCPSLPLEAFAALRVP